MQTITIDATRSLNPEHQISSIEPGKTASFPLLADHPFEIETLKPGVLR